MPDRGIISRPSHTKIKNEMSFASFQVVYDGPILQNNEMDVYDLAPALLAFGQLMEETGSVLYGEKFRITVQVKASFKTGCFGIEMIAAAKNQFLDLFGNSSAAALATCLGLLGLNARNAGESILDFIIWLKNRKITSTEKIIDSNNIRVFVDNEHFVIEEQALVLLRNKKIREAFEKIITKPLSREGIDTFAITHVGSVDDKIFLVNKQDSIYFSVPNIEDESLNEYESIVSLQIINACFQDGNKWKFTDGVQSFYADIDDQKFVEQVNGNEISFAKDDILKVRLHHTQWLTEKGIKSEYSIAEVLEHRSGQRQIDLFIN